MNRKAASVILLLMIGIGSYCGYRYYQDSVLPEKVLDENHDEQIRLFESVKPELPENPLSNEKTADLLKPAEEVNDGVVGWITIDGTHIDFPICQAQDNDFYLHNGFDGQYNNELGCPFLDYRCEGDFSGFNSIVYGHNISQQRMFADIALFKDKAYLQSHQKGTLTLNDGVHNVDFFSYMNVRNTAPAYHAVFVRDSEKEEYIDYIFSDSVHISNYSADDLKQRDDLHLLLLSTCTYEFTDARGILIGIIE